MNSQEINFATAQVILNILHGNKTLQIYENPVSKIEELCETTKKVIEKNSKGEMTNEGLPFDLPFQIFQKEPQLFSSLGQDIYSKTLKKEWMKKEPTISREEHKKMIETVYKKYIVETSEKERREYVLKELREAPVSFIRELYDLAISSSHPKKLVETIDNWSSYELEGIFDKVEQKNSERASLTSFRSGDGINSVLEEFIKTEFIPSDKDSIKTLRDNFAESILFNFKNVFDLSNEKFTLNTYFKIKKIDNSYKGSFPPSLNYVRTIFMPWLLLFKTGGIRNEKMIYVQFNEDYKKTSKT